MTTQPSTIRSARQLSPPSSPPSAPQPYPFALRMIIALFIVKAIGIILVFIGIGIAPSLPDDLEIEITALAQSPETLVTYFVLAPLQLLAAIGLWRRKRWAWVLTMALLAYSMTLDLVSFMGGQAFYVSMALNVIQVGYLNQKEVQDLFGENGKRETL